MRPIAIDVHLWPYALCYAYDMLNHAPYKGNGQAMPMEWFSGAKVSINPKHAHNFGGPV
jgi:hypothetical protein